MEKYIIKIILLLTTIYSASATGQPEIPFNPAPQNPAANASPLALPPEYDYDYSYDFSTGYYKMYIICELTIQNNCGDIYTGWIDPDGSKSLGEAYTLSFTVKGGNGWKLEAGGFFGSDAESFSSNVIAYPIDESTGKTNYSVFISGSRWEYNGFEVQSGNFLSAGSSLLTLRGEELYRTPDFNSYGFIDTLSLLPGSKSTIKGKQSFNNWITGENQADYSEVASDACTGAGIIAFVPGTVWAFPDAQEGNYIFPLSIEFDYLTFDSEGFYDNYKINDLNVPQSIYVFGITQ